MKNLSNITNIEELFELWKQEHINETDISYFGNNIPKEIFLEDGIIDINLYNSAKKKILILGKERYQHYSDKCLEVNKGLEQTFWHKDVAFGRVKETLFSKFRGLLFSTIL